MLKMRFAILGAAAALTLGTATALAMTESATFGGGDSHGDAVASAARNCAHGAGGVHGACVSSVARTNGETNSDSGSGQPAFVKACKALRGNKPGSRGIGACVSAHAKAQGGGGTSGTENESGS
jgi:hypothetical protein